jgi:hypothetical protein
VEATKKAYKELNAILGELATAIVHTIDQVIPYLARMQSLLSQRDADRKKVLNKAGLPGWTKWAEGYAKKLNCTVRTIRLHIKQLREGYVYRASAQADVNKRRVKLDAPQQAALVRAQLAANKLVATLKSGGDWHSALVEYDKVAISPARLDEFLDALEGEDFEHEVPDAASARRFWLIPRDVYARLDEEFHFDFDACPHPRPDGYDSLNVEWGRSNYVNPPFFTLVGADGRKRGMTAWVRKAIEEQAKGNTSVLVYPQHAWVHALVEAEAEFRSLGPVEWMSVEDPSCTSRSSSPIMAFILRGAKREK